MIRVNGKYAIDVDENQYIVKAFHTGEKGKSKGVEVSDPIGYYTSLCAAIKGVRDRIIRDSLSEYDGGLDGALMLVESIDEEFTKRYDDED